MRIIEQANAGTSPSRLAKRLLLATALSTAALSGVAYAADAPAKTASVEEVVVTGSRIRGTPPVGSTLIGVTRDDIAMSNAVTTTQVIQEVPQVFNLGVSESSRGQAGGSSNITYGSSINIRGIGPYATLILLDGHRAVPQGTSGFAIDPSVLPTIGLQRVDVVADGSSAIYGSDAIAGVVNLILRRNVEGFEMTARAGTGDAYKEHQVGLIFGHKWSTGQVTVAFENGYHSAVSGRDRSFYRADLTPFGGNDFRQTLCDPGNIVVGGVSYAIPAGGVTAANRNSLVAGTVNKCDNPKIADILPRQNHNALSFTANNRINDRLTVFTEGFAAKRDFTFRTGAASSSLNVPNTNAFFVAPPGLTPTSETVQYSFINAYPQGYSDGFSQAVDITVGADYDMGGNWKMETDYTWGRDDDRSLSHNVANAAALTAALASNNPATAFNPFGAANSPSVVQGILIGWNDNKGRTTFEGGEVKFDGPVVNLPGGEMRAAFGYEGQRMNVDQLTNAGTITAKTGASRYFHRGVNSLYAELLVPIVGPGNAMTGVKALNVDLAERYDEYSDVGSTRNPKIGVNWSVTDDFLIHGSWGTSFRAPTIAQIYGNSNNLFVQNYADPTCGGCIRQGVARSGGNGSLRPETATTWSVGADWTPISNAKLSLTYFDINYENQVSNFLADLTVLQKESQFAGTNVITRNPSAAFMAQQVAETGFTGVLPNPVLVFVDGRSQNLGVTIARGFDFQSSYRVPTEHMGDFAFTLNGSYFTKYVTSITPSAPLINNNNVIFNPLRFKARGSMRWSTGPYLASVAVNWENAYTNNLSTPIQTVKAYSTTDLHLGYNIPGDSGWFHGSSIGLDVRNLFDAKPPFVNIAESANGGGGFDPTVTDPIGRVVSISIGTKF